MADPVAEQTTSLPGFVVCPVCHGKLRSDQQQVACSACGALYSCLDGIPLLFASDGRVEDVVKVQSLYNQVAHEYDAIFPRHIAEHYLDKRLAIVRRLSPSGLVLDVGCGTGQLGAYIATAGYQVVGLDVSPRMLARATARGLAGAFAGYATSLPFAANSFDLALTVATLHHLDTPVRVARTISEMGRVVRAGGFLLIWDHNPLNPYWKPLMRRVPQDTGDERLVPLEEVLADVTDAGLEVVSACRLGLVPEFVPAPLMPLARAIERFVEQTRALSWLAAHNVVVARKP